MATRRDLRGAQRVGGRLQGDLGGHRGSEGGYRGTWGYTEGRREVTGGPEGTQGVGGRLQGDLGVHNTHRESEGSYRRTWGYTYTQLLLIRVPPACLHTIHIHRAVEWPYTPT